MAALVSSFRHPFQPPACPLRRRQFCRTLHGEQGMVRSQHRRHDCRLFATQSTISQFQRTKDEIHLTNATLAIVKEAIRSVDPSNAVKQHVRVDPSNGMLQIGSRTGSGNHRVYNNAQDFDNVLLLVFGKAFSAMATACKARTRTVEKSPYERFRHYQERSCNHRGV
jgi:Domain of unknown function (DUF4147)